MKYYVHYIEVGLGRWGRSKRLHTDPARLPTVQPAHGRMAAPEASEVEP